MLLALLFLLTAVFFFTLGAIVDSKYHAAFSAEKDNLVDEYKVLAAKAHAATDAIVAHFRSHPTVVVSAATNSAPPAVALAAPTAVIAPAAGTSAAPPPPAP